LLILYNEKLDTRVFYKCYAGNQYEVGIATDIFIPSRNIK